MCTLGPWRTTKCERNSGRFRRRCSYRWRRGPGPRRESARCSDDPKAAEMVRGDRLRHGDVWPGPGRVRHGGPHGDLRLVGPPVPRRAPGRDGRRARHGPEHALRADRQRDRALDRPRPAGHDRASPAVLRRHRPPADDRRVAGSTRTGWRRPGSSRDRTSSSPTESCPTSRRTRSPVPWPGSPRGFPARRSRSTPTQPRCSGSSTSWPPAGASPAGRGRATTRALSSGSACGSWSPRRSPGRRRACARGCPAVPLPAAAGGAGARQGGHAEPVSGRLS